ncbi:8-oxo-dGTP pyrophosphatase MutT, NUDIX family [Asanoa hainanensis]|uniref:8-oxo-dGTP pyrophosphatase MutT, NUDIX family n=1 Tax=Asanoa hainanensis TaxID=560556 RepID=A0A239LDC7_9ACTN|nr:NUDIX hydrolase [Asanoa hainanensis]SNT27649.1 8-oxo-dGTP pyrophosphatase MutT, NUDIX family [Asanoa hainanensis]
MTFDLTAHIAGLGRVRAAAGVLFRDSAGGVLLVRPTYESGWEVPGGSVEADESPLAAARREVREELGVDFPVGRLLVVDWVEPSPPWDAGLMFVFSGGTLDAAAVARIVLPADELSSFAFVPLAALDDHLRPRLARRVRAAALGADGIYLESGYQTSPSRQSQTSEADRSSGMTPGKT